MTATAQVPTCVADAVCQRWPDRGPAWLADVESELQTLCDRFQASPIHVYGARYGFVVAVATSDRTLVMRASTDPDGRHQASVALGLADLGIGPEVYDVVHTATGSWTVMEQISPGASFSELPPGPEFLGALSSTLQQLVSTPPVAEGLPLLHDWLEHRLIDDNLTELAPGRSAASSAERMAALEVLPDLAGSPDRMCHGDLSPGNVLYRNDGRLALIDPRGIAGDAAYDVAVISMKVPQYGPPPDVGSTLATNLDIDPARVHAWQAVAHAARV